jgi:hypothetical protein
LSGSDQRQQVANAIRLLMRQIARVAKVLKRSEYPGAREKLQVPRSNGYSALLTRRSLYLETLPSIKSPSSSAECRRISMSDSAR